MRKLSILVVVGFAAIGLLLFVHPIKLFLFGGAADFAEVEANRVPDLRERFQDQGLLFGSETFIRIFKEERELEIWIAVDKAYRLFQTYPICNYSGELGPKLAEGDRQSPEGFYTVPASAMNPNSSYHLSFNLGFPNAYDQSHDRTGSYLMVHGNCVSVGCYAMTDAGIEEIYSIVDAAQKEGQSAVPVHAFPFRMTEQRLEQEVANEWYDFWVNLKAGYDAFEATKRPPRVSVDARRYVFGPA